MTSAEHLAKVKAKLNAIKEKIDQTEDRELEAKEKLREAEERLEKALGEVDSFKRRIQLVQIEDKKVRAALEVKVQELDGMERRSKSEEEQCKSLEITDRESDEKMHEMEDLVEETDIRDKDVQTKVAEVELKFKVTQNELEKALQRAEKFENISSMMEDQLTGNVETMASLEEKDAEACEREIEGEEKVAFMQDELKAMVYRYEEAERKAPPLENLIFAMMEDMDNLKIKRKEVEDEMKAMGDLVEEVTVEKSAPKPSPFAEPKDEAAEEEEEEEEE
ncbi:tropomyosin-1 [Exaiptasia diaphana]|uniref:Tropomyosin n=1 Tax=Exaiptasia diaphana TaxID=2652724 RepID=A0A913X8Z2_EXADI|nr:tropomyosin-1 [Exaiptasia diaphana]KXJ14052.1 Tropomyosin-1 [Exaiptasia diaphana]